MEKRFRTLITGVYGLINASFFSMILITLLLNFFSPKTRKTDFHKYKCSLQAMSPILSYLSTFNTSVGVFYYYPNKIVVAKSQMTYNMTDLKIIFNSHLTRLLSGI